jgi:hypothetical protein
LNPENLEIPQPTPFCQKMDKELSWVAGIEAVVTIILYAGTIVLAQALRRMKGVLFSVVECCSSRGEFPPGRYMILRGEYQIDR